MEQKKNTDKTGLIVGILSIPCGLLIAISGWILGIVGIVINAKNKGEKNATAGLVLSIIGLVVSVTNSVFGVLINTGVI